MPRPETPKIEYSGDFKEDFGMFIEIHLDTMETWIEKIDKSMRDLAKGSEKAVSDVFSDKLMLEIKVKINAWTQYDDILGDEFSKMCDHYKPTIALVDMKKQAKEKLVELDVKIRLHVDLANENGIKWTNQIDNAGIVVSDKLTKTTIDWFRELTVAELKRLYAGRVK